MSVELGVCGSSFSRFIQSTRLHTLHSRTDLVQIESGVEQVREKWFHYLNLALTRHNAEWAREERGISAPVSS